MSTSRIKITEQVQLHLALLVEFYHFLLIIASVLSVLYCTAVEAELQYFVCDVCLHTVAARANWVATRGNAAGRIRLRKLTRLVRVIVVRIG